MRQDQIWEPEVMEDVRRVGWEGERALTGTHRVFAEDGRESINVDGLWEVTCSK